MHQAQCQAPAKNAARNSEYFRVNAAGAPGLGVRGALRSGGDDEYGKKIPVQDEVKTKVWGV
jgi:hypothetical protein